MRKEFISFCFIMLCFSAAFAALPSMQIHVRSKDGTLQGKERLKRAGWMKSNSERGLDGWISGEQNKWNAAKFSFIPEKTGMVFISLKGPSGNADQWILLDNVKMNGVLVPNGDFEAGFQGWQKGAWGKSPAPPRLLDDGNFVQFGKKCVMVRHSSPIMRELPVKAGELVTLEMMFRPIENLFAAVPGDIPLPLTKVANMGFADQTAGDGKGGWSDQGPKNDLRNFNKKRNLFCGITFAFPQQVQSIVTFDGEHFHNAVRSVTLDVPAGTQKKYLYLLHTGCWCPSSGIVGRIRFTGENGSSKEILVQAGVDIRDWWGPVTLANAIPAWKTTGGDAKGLYLSRFEIPFSPLKSVTLTTEGKSTWILCGVTLSSQKNESAGANAFSPDASYLPADISETPRTAAGSALDFSSLDPNAPCGTYGKVVIAADGTLEFEKQPGKPLRFRQIYHMGNWQIAKAILQKKSKEAIHALIDLDFQEPRLRGYNMVRTHGIDSRVDFERAGGQDPVWTDAIDYYFATAKKNGFYINLNLAAYALGYSKEKLQKDRGSELKTKMLLGDESVRRMWLKTAEYFLCRKNPYTGTMLKDDPMLVMVEPYNELAFGLTRRNGAVADRMVREKFQAFLDKKFGKHVTDVPAYPAVNPHHYRREWTEFHYNCIRETMQFFRHELSKMGVTVPVAQYNLAWHRLYGDVRYEFDDIIIKNAYFAHPSRYMAIGSQCDLRSALQTGGAYFRKSAATRFADRPMVITEYNHAFWNQYEYEQPMFAVYSAFQGYSGLSMHAVRLWPTWFTASDFASSLMDQACELLCYLFFQRGDVTPSRQLISLSIPKRSQFDDGALGAISQEQTRAVLLSRFAVKYEDTPKPEKIAGFATPVPLVSIPLMGGSSVKQSLMFVEEQDDKTTAFDFRTLVNQLRKNGILSAENRTDARKEIYESDTGEIFLNAPEKVMTVKTEKSEMIMSEYPTSESLPCLKSVKSDIPATVAIAAIDGKKLVDSKRMLLFYLTAVANTGFELSGDRVTLRKIGTLPILLRTGKLDVTLSLNPDRQYMLYPLRSDGTRREGIPLKSLNGKWQLKLDTAKLPHGPTLIFEISAL